MDTIDIQPEKITIHDDPEFCGKIGGKKEERCFYSRRFSSAWICNLFRKKIENPALDINIYKCTQCKEAWKKAKEYQPSKLKDLKYSSETALMRH